VALFTCDSSLSRTSHHSSRRRWNWDRDVYRPISLNRLYRVDIASKLGWAGQSPSRSYRLTEGRLPAAAWLGRINLQIELPPGQVFRHYYLRHLVLNYESNETNNFKLRCGAVAVLVVTPSANAYRGRSRWCRCPGFWLVRGLLGLGKMDLASTDRRVPQAGYRPQFRPSPK